MCKQRGVITHYRRGGAPVRHSVKLDRRGGIKIDGATWEQVMRRPWEWTFGSVSSGLVDYVRQLDAAKRRERSVYV